MISQKTDFGQSTASQPHIPQLAESRLGHFEARVVFVTGTEFQGDLF